MFDTHVVNLTYVYYCPSNRYVFGRWSGVRVCGVTGMLVLKLTHVYVVQLVVLTHVIVYRS